MQSSIGDITTCAPTERDVIPEQVELRLPAVPGVGEVATALIGAVARAWDVHTRVGAIGEAARAVADELAKRATAWSGLGLSLERDDLDVYVRLAADVTPDDEPTLTPATDAAVSRATDSHHVAMEDARLLVVLQAALR